MASSQSIAERINALSESTIGSIREGFSTLVKISPEAREELFKKISETIASGASNIDLEPFVEQTGLGTNDVGAVVNAFSGTIGLAADGSYDEGDFLSAVRERLYDEAAAPVVTDFIKRIIADAPGWKTRIDRRNMSVETLPAFLSLDTSIDLRLRIVKDKIIDAAPVLIVHLDTDAPAKEIWFQATRGDVKLLVDRLNKVDHDMEVAEQFYLQNRDPKP